MQYDEKHVAGWLRDSLKLSGLVISYAGLFGSIVKGSANPGDCDVLVVISDEYTDFAFVREQLHSIGRDFLSVFGIPLSFQCLTESEFEPRWAPLLRIRQDGIVNLLGMW